MPTKAPSGGTKVTRGENIPVTREATGNVVEGSLAAESTAEGGGFAANKPALEGQEQGRRRQQPQQQPQHGRGSTRRTGAGDTSTSLGLENQQTSRGTAAGGNDTTAGGTRHTRKTAGTGEGPTSSSQPAAAPTYVASQYIRNPAGPHGKNLHEGGFEGSGTAEGELPEPGSIEDPGRAALGLGVGGTASSRGGSGKEEEGSGLAPGQGGRGEKTWYTALGDEDA
ncbi:hypothetical protein B0J18DRAFT_460657 [Chaetomium sp. MPI-SDFR-AT-0129]|nr:hypothetical protein B0J18DRAFT_460657 [Chaetomium sp. MPI-SDFR-AT-0129]